MYQRKLQSETDKMEIIVYYKSYIINEHLKIEELKQKIEQITRVQSYIKVGKPGGEKELAKSEREQVKFKGKRIEWDMRDRN